MAAIDILTAGDGGGGGSSSGAAATYYVDPVGGDNGNAGTSAAPFETINAALAAAQPGDTVWLEPGFYDQDVDTVRAGTAGAPITIAGTDDAIIRGGTTTTRTFEIKHSHIWVDGITFDGLHTPGTPGAAASYRNKMVYVVPSAEDGTVYLEGVRLLNLVVRNCLDEGIRVRFTNHFEVGWCRIHDTGKDDYVFAGVGDNGEGIYVGTSPDQLTGVQVDRSHGWWVHHIDATALNGSEAVNAKEGTHNGLIEYVTASACQQTTVGAVNVQGRLTTVQYCDLSANLGSGVRVGEAAAPLDGADSGDSCTVRHNRVDGNGDWGVKVVTSPQTLVCGNTGSGNTSGFQTGAATAADACALPAPGVARGWRWADGHARLGPYTESCVLLPADDATLDLDLALANNFRLVSPGQNVTFAMANVPTGGPAAIAFTLKIINHATPRTFTWPAAFKWPNGIAPTIGASARWQISGVTWDNGTTYNVQAVGPYA